MTEQEQLHLKLKKLGVYEEFIENTIEGDNYVDVCGAFEWDETVEGSSYWSEIDDITLDMKDIIYTKIIGGDLL